MKFWKQDKHKPSGFKREDKQLWPHELKYLFSHIRFGSCCWGSLQTRFAQVVQTKMIPANQVPWLNLCSGFNKKQMQQQRNNNTKVGLFCSLLFFLNHSYPLNTWNSHFLQHVCAHEQHPDCCGPEENRNYTIIGKKKVCLNQWIILVGFIISMSKACEWTRPPLSEWKPDACSHLPAPLKHWICLDLK